MSLKFVNLHGHDGHSVYDAIGSPEDYIEWMLKNAGEDSGALAITNHGNMNSIGSMVAAQKKYSKKGAPVKLIYGVEAYFTPSLQQWSELKIKRDEEKKEEKKRKKKADGDDASDLVIENERDSKGKYFDPFMRRNHLVLVATNQEGLKNLFRLVTRSYREGFYKKPRIDLDMLRKLNSGIIASTACLAGVPSWCSLQSPDTEAAMQLYDRELLPLMEIFGKDRFFLELQFNRIAEQQIVNQHLIEYSKRSGYNLIATADCHYPDPEMFRDREIYRLLGHQMQKREIDFSILEKQKTDMDCELYLKNGDQMFAAYKESFESFHPDQKLIIDAIQRTHDIAHHAIGQVAPDDTIKLPKTFQITDKIRTPFDQLKEYVLDALKKKNLTSPEYIDRASFELKVIKNIKVEEYFLAMKEILDTLKKHMLIGPARGSGAGSLVNYLLGITLLDPIKHGLLFERFLSPSRAELPDVDSDVESKDEAFEILKNHFGEESVLAISNYNRLTLKALIKDLAKLYGIPFQEVNSVTKVAEGEARAHILEDCGHDQKLYDFTFEKAKQYSPTFNEFLQKYPHLGESVENLFKEVKAVSRHAGGVLIVPDAESCLPIIRIRDVDQSPITEGITAQHLKFFGLVKFDVLGLGTLRIIRRCIETILRKNGQEVNIENVWEFYNTFLHPDVIDPTDQNVFTKVYGAGRFPSIFQFEKQRSQNFCVRAAPMSVKDLSAITALWRPGPLKGKADVKYVHFDENAVSKEHPIIKERLGETRGLLLYQEQFMLLASALAGFTLEEADKLRKLLVKPATTDAEQIRKERKEIGDKFIASCIERGVNQDRAEALWEKEILGFISYGFNKSHAMAYAYNSYHCAWLYTYYEEEWIKACLECDPELEKTIATTRSLGYTINKVDVNHSPTLEWNVDGTFWKPPLTSLKGLGAAGATELAREKPKDGFTDINNFFFDSQGDWRWTKLNKKIVEILIKAEAFSSLNCVGPDKMFKNYKHMHDFISENWEQLKNGKITFDEAPKSECDDWPASEKIVLQREIMGFYDKGLVISKFTKMFKEFDITAMDEFGLETVDEEEEYKGDMIRVWGIVEKVIEKKTVHGKPFLSVTATGMSEKPYYFRIWAMSKAQTNVWEEGNVVVFSLDYDEEYGYSLSRKSKIVKVTR